MWEALEGLAVGHLEALEGVKRGTPRMNRGRHRGHLQPSKGRTIQPDELPPLAAGRILKPWMWEPATADLP